ncbi:hypothetical protein [Streptomyces sp. NPDC058255]|uniref:hypothetical protein n=1 Tax=Streptomyces sp. NPDC058255 TaxID=3346407 RepID=UPI0036E7C744
MSNPERSTVYGVLLEGNNYSGKSSVARALGQKLTARGDTVRQRHCYVVDSEASMDLQRQAFDAVKGWEGRPYPDADLLRGFNVRKSAQILVDSGLIRESAADLNSGAIVIQDRHWFTQYCSNEFFNPGEGLLSEAWLCRHAPRFTVQVYLTCTQEERERRARLRIGPEKHNLNAYQRAHLSELASYDAFCRSVIEDDLSWQIIETDQLPPEAVADSILHTFDAARSAPAGIQAQKEGSGWV